jgi:hypothetical protein
MLDDLNKKREIMWDNLIILNHILTQNNIFYWVAEGTALGFTRNKNIILGDSDVDIGIPLKYKYKVLGLLNNNNIFSIKKHIPLKLTRRGETIDIDFVKPGYPSMAVHWPLPANYVHLLYPFEIMNIRNIDYTVPSVKYIKYLYGADWKIEKKNYKPNVLKIYLE